MKLDFEIWGPTHSKRSIERGEVWEVFQNLPEGASAIFTWNDCEEECLIVAIEPDFSVVTMGRDASFWNLKISDDTEPVEIRMGADEFTWSRGCLLPRNMAVEVMLKLEDFDSLFRDYSWVDA